MIKDIELPGIGEVLSNVNGKEVIFIRESLFKRVLRHFGLRVLRYDNYRIIHVYNNDRVTVELK